MCEWFNVWLSLRLLHQQQQQQQQQQPRLLLLDDHPLSPLDVGWDLLFGGASTAGSIMRVRPSAASQSHVIVLYAVRTGCHTLQARDLWGSAAPLDVGWDPLFGGASADLWGSAASPSTSAIICAEEIVRSLSPVSFTPPSTPRPLFHQPPPPPPPSAPDNSAARLFFSLVVRHAHILSLQATVQANRRFRALYAEVLRCKIQLLHTAVAGGGRGDERAVCVEESGQKGQRLNG